MSSVSASDFKNVMNINDSLTNLEYVLDLAIDVLNLYGAEAIDNMAGSGGSKTVTLTSRQRGGVFLLARVIYHEFYKHKKNVSVGGVTLTVTDLLSNPTVMSTVEKMSKKLSTVDFLVGEDTSGM